MGKVTKFVAEMAGKTSEEKLINFWTLRFINDQLEDLFNADNSKQLTRKRLELLLLSILISISAVYMIITSLHTLGLNDMIFYFCMFAYNIVPNVLLYFPKYQKYCQILFCISPAGTAIFLIVLSVYIINAPSDSRDYQAGFASLAMFLMFSILRVTYYMACISSALILLAHAIAVICVGYGVYAWYKILGFTFGLLSTVIVAACAGYFMELKHRSVLLHKQILSEEAERLQLTRARLDKLLLNIFPKKIMEKLKKLQPNFKQGMSAQQLLVIDRWGSGQAVLNHHYPSVSVLLADIVGFTPLSAIVGPRSMVSILNNIFSSFDDILDAHNMEKVRTIGDAYLCVGNMTKNVEKHQEMAVRAGWHMLQYIKTLPAIKGIKINLRIGISCGPISAGVVGTTKWNYDIFGQTYSDAITAEGSSIAGYITVTENVYRSLFDLEIMSWERVENEGSVRYRLVELLLPMSVPSTKTLLRHVNEADAAAEAAEALANVEKAHNPDRVRNANFANALRILLPDDEDEVEEIDASNIDEHSGVSSSSSPFSTPPTTGMFSFTPISQFTPPISQPTTPSSIYPIPLPTAAGTTAPTTPITMPPTPASAWRHSNNTHTPSSSSVATTTNAAAALRSQQNDFEPRDLDLSQQRPPKNNLFTELRTSKFFQNLMRSHGVSNPEYSGYSVGVKRHQVERDMLEKEEDRIKRGFLHMRFSSRTLEEDFWEHFLQNAQRHLSSLSFCLTGAIILWVFSDLLSSPVPISEMHHGVWFCFAVAASSSFAFGVYIASSLYHHWTSKWVCMIMMFVIGLSISFVTYFDHQTIFHFYHMYCYLCIVFMFTRVWVIHSIIPVGIVTIVTMYLCFLYLPARTAAVYRRNILAAIFCCVALIVVNFIAYVGLEKTLRTEFIMTRLIQNEYELHQRANETTKMLVRNILPGGIVSRLTSGGNKVSIVDHIPTATIMFIGIPNLYESAKPAHIFYLLNDIYTLFDELTLSFGLEKIKAVNSTYMVASGVPQQRPDHMVQMLLLAKKMFEAMAGFKSQFLEGRVLDVRIGIATGDVVAAIVGKKKYTYDCWSDCVNTAARMESHGVVGSIQVTEAVYRAQKDHFPFQERGEIYVKGKGLMRTYLMDPFDT